MCKSYSTFSLFNMYFFFSIIDLCSFFLLYLKAWIRVQCFCTIHPVFLRCTSTTPFCWATICFLIFFLKFWTVATVPSWFNQIYWAKIHYSTYNFFGLTFCIFFSLHTILSKNTQFCAQKQKQKFRKKTFFILYVWGSLQFFLKL